MSAIIFLLISLVVSFQGQSSALRVLTDLERCLDLCETYSCQNDRNIRDGCNEMFSCAHGCKLRQLGVVKGFCRDLCRRNDVNAPAIGSRLTNGESRCEPNVSGWKFDLCRECNRGGCTPRPQVWECEQGCNFYKDTEAPKQEGESCGPCFCPPTYSAGDCAEGLTCERDERLPDAAGVCTRPENPCSSGRPLTDPSGVELFCGRGPNRVECPTGSSCLVHPTDRYALCCPEEAPKQEGESCGSCFCPPTYSAGDCAEGLTCERDERIPDAAGICTRPAPPKKEGEECGSCLCPPTFSAGDCEEGLTCVRDERIPDLAGICARPAPDLCAEKGCGEQCDSSLGLLQVVRYCQPDGSCGTNARPSCPETRKKVGEKCGSCFCPPTFSAGTCEDGLNCKRDPRIPDRAGVCEPNLVKGIVFPQK